MRARIFEMKYRVIIKRADGTEEKRDVEAASRFAVYEAVQKEGGVVASLEEGGGGIALPSWLSFQIGSGVKIEERITLAKNLSAMLSAGLTLSRAISVIERQSQNKYLKRIMKSIEDGVRSGKAFHESLEQHGAVFSRLFIAMTKAGEESGKLGEALQVVARQMDRTYTLQKKIKGAMIYPSIILVAIVVIGILMMVFVVPTLSKTFVDLGVELPIATRIIVGVSDFMVANVFLVFVLLIGFGIGSYFVARTKRGSAAILAVALRLPVIGELVRQTMSARSARTLASLLSSGVEMLTALSITYEVVGDNVFGAVVKEAEERVRKGEPLSAAFNEYPKLVPIFMTDMIMVGEETGKVSEMLLQVAEYYEVDVEDRTKDLSTIIEPVLMLFIGAFVGVFALAMIAPIYSLSSSI
jgi:type IV pilus assembly protein PilC